MTERTCNYRVWISGVGYLDFPTDRLGVEWLAGRWSSIQGRKLTLSERGGVVEGHDPEGERCLVASKDADKELGGQREDGARWFPMGMTGRFMHMNKVPVLEVAQESPLRIEVGKLATVVLGLDDLSVRDALKVRVESKNQKLDVWIADEEPLKGLISKIADRLAIFDLAPNEKATLRRAEAKITEAL